MNFTGPIYISIMNPNLASYGKIAIATCFMVCIGDFLVTFIIGFLSKHYNFLLQSESFLGTDDNPFANWIMAWGVLFSVLFLIYAYALFKIFSSRSRLQILVVCLIAIYGLGEGIGSGLFPYNHIGKQLSFSAELHSIFSGIGVTALNILPFVLLKLYPRKLAPLLHDFYLFVGISGIVFVIIFMLAREGIVPFRGLWQRIFILDYYLMLMILSIDAGSKVIKNEKDQRRKV